MRLRCTGQPSTERGGNHKQRELSHFILLAARRAAVSHCMTGMHSIQCSE
jgi:hypothetical protein